jgi:hypothetical protein
LKQYPSISREPIRGSSYYVFDKLDGSNLRAEWHPKKNFWKFGSRTQPIDPGSNKLGLIGIPVIKAQEHIIGNVLRKMGAEEATCFFEFHGADSFAGVHQWETTLRFQAVLFDVCVYKKGFLSPQEFVKNFEGVIDIPQVLHIGNVTDCLIRKVRKGTLKGMTFEGVVCKGAPLKNGYPPHMFKIKSQAWIDKVKSLYTDPKLLEELL